MSYSINKARSRRFGKSNSDMVYEYFTALLEDGCEHSMREIKDYIFDKTGSKGVDGEDLTESMIASSIWVHTKRTASPYVNTRRGFYQKNTKDDLFGKGRFGLYAQADQILDRAIEGVTQVFTIDVTELTVEEFKEYQRLELLLLDTLSSAKDHIYHGTEASDEQ
jgi:hypothetical protein